MEDEPFNLLDHMAQYDPRLFLTSEGRRAATKMDPLCFSVVYFRDSLRMKDGPHVGEVSFSQFHLDLCDKALRWALCEIGFKAIRDAWIAPRDCGKSTWMFLILPMWALAHGHRRFAAAFADTAGMAEGHLATFKRELAENAYLRRDFPNLCRPKRRPSGVSDTDRRDMYLSASGAVFAARGIDSNALGLKVGNQRPDLIILDDIEQMDGSGYSLYQKTQRLRAVIDGVLPMNNFAVVQAVGTVVMRDSIIHDLVKQQSAPSTTPAWVAEEKFSAHYYPAIVIRPDGRETSVWPQKWPMAVLNAERHKSSFPMTFMNQPRTADSPYWRDAHFITAMPDRTRFAPTHRVISVDPGVTTKRSSDFTGIAVVSYYESARMVVLEHAQAFMGSGPQIRAKVLELAAQFDAPQIVVESNQGGDLWRSTFEPLPHGVQLVLKHQDRSKEVRWALALRLWDNSRVVHDPDGDVSAFEDQAVSVPHSAHDDVVDCVVTAVLHLAGKLLEPPPRRATSRSYVP